MQLIIALLASQLFVAVPVDPVIDLPIVRPNPAAKLSIADQEDPVKVWAEWLLVNARPLTEIDRDTASELRLRHCQPGAGGLTFGVRARRVDTANGNKPWFVSRHPTFGIVAVDDDALLDEFGCAERFLDGHHDKMALSSYFDVLVRAGQVRMFASKCRYDDEGDPVNAPCELPADWVPAGDEQ